LEDNLAKNHLHNVRAVNVAVSDRAGVLGLFAGPETHCGLTTVVAGRNLQPECEIQSAPLSTLLRPEEISSARLVKIDVEGAEAAVAAGMGPLLKNGRPDLEILLEVHTDHLKQQGKSPEDVLSIFTGFHAYALENDYTAQSCLARRYQQKPRRVREPINCEINLILSRIDEETLQ
jgi:FkbM family methyltransferase